MNQLERGSNIVSKEAAEIARQQLIVRHLFGDQHSSSNDSEIGRLLEKEFKENVVLKNMNISSDSWFLIGLKDNHDNIDSSGHPYIDIKVSYSSNSPDQSYVGVSVYGANSDRPLLESDIFLFSDKNFSKQIKDFIRSKKDIF